MARIPHPIGGGQCIGRRHGERTVAEEVPQRLRGAARGTVRRCHAAFVVHWKRSKNTGETKVKPCNQNGILENLENDVPVPMTDPFSVLRKKYGVPWIPSTKTPVMLALIYQHQPDPSWDMKTSISLGNFPSSYDHRGITHIPISSSRWLVKIIICWCLKSPDVWLLFIVSPLNQH